MTMADDRVKNNINKIFQLLHFKCPSYLANCTTHNCMGGTMAVPHPCFQQWLVSMKCKQCLRAWNVCRLCAPAGTQNDRMTIPKNAEIHHYKHLQDNAREENNMRNLTTKRKITLEVHTKENVDILEPTIYTKKLKSETSSDRQRMGDIEMFLQNYFDSHQAYEYFINKMHGKGHNYLSSKQQTDDLSSVKDIDSEIDMILANIFICSTKSTRKLLAMLLSKISRDPLF